MFGYKSSGKECQIRDDVKRVFWKNIKDINSFPNFEKMLLLNSSDSVIHLPSIEYKTDGNCY